MKDEWYTPEEKMPPYGKKVLLNIKFPYIESGMHTMGWFQPDGWHVLALVNNYIVEKWRYFNNGEYY